MRLLSFCAALFIFLCGISLNAQPTRISLVPVLSNLAGPVLYTNAGDGTDRRFVIEQIGRIRVQQPGAATTTLFLDLTARVLFGDERGVLGLAFHPQFATNGRFFVNYTRRPDGATVVAEYRNGLEQRVLFTVAQPYANHNGGGIAFGPDGLLYIGMGDGGSGNDPENRAQNPSMLLGKFLRINVDVPNSQPQIFATGFRNPWRFSFDRMTGDLYAGDVGQNAREEIDIVRQGGNYGWRVFEGTRCTGLGPASCSSPGFVPPITEYVNTAPTGRCAVIGGFVYRGSQSSLPGGAYTFGDLCTGEIFMFNDGVQTMLLDSDLQITSFGEDEAGEIYVVDGVGAVYHITNPDAINRSQHPFETGSSSAFVTSTEGIASGLTVAYGRMKPANQSELPSGLAVFGLRRDGVLVSETSVPASQAIEAGRIFAEVGPNVNTGVAFANPNTEAVTISFFFTDGSGTNSGNGELTISPGHQIAAFLNQTPFNGPNSILGSFTFSASAPVAAIGLRGFTNERGDFLMTTSPVNRFAGQRPPPPTIAHFAVGGGWTTDIIVVNISDAPFTSNAQFINRAGQIIQTIPFSLAPRSSTRINSPAFSGVQSGSVKINAPVAAFAIFSNRLNNVTVTQTAASTPPAATAFSMYVENNEEVRSGFAIANPSDSAVSVQLEVSGLTAALSIPANGQTSVFINEVQGFAALPLPLQGVLRITAPSPIAVTGLRSRINERGEFLVTASAAVSDSENAGATELLFPHLAEGAGYSMQLILFGRASSGTIFFFDQNGNPAPLFFR